MLNSIIFKVKLYMVRFLKKIARIEVETTLKFKNHIDPIANIA